MKLKNQVFFIKLYHKIVNYLFFPSDALVVLHDGLVIIDNPAKKKKI